MVLKVSESSGRCTQLHHNKKRGRGRERERERGRGMWEWETSSVHALCSTSGLSMAWLTTTSRVAN